MTRSYWIRLGRRTEGPFTLEDLQHRIARGTLTPAHSVSQDGRVWRVAARCPELFGSAIAGTGAVRDSQSIDVSAAQDLDEEFQAHGADDVPASEPEMPPEMPDALTAAQPASHERPQTEAADPGAHDVAALQGSLADHLVLAWPAQLACIFTLLLACGMPMARDAGGALWWWHAVRLWNLGGADLCAAAAGWAGVTVAALASSFAIWALRGTAQRTVLTRAGAVSIALVSMAWATGMAGGLWTLPQCMVLACAIWMTLDAMELPGAASPEGAGPRRGRSAWLAAGTCAAVISIGASIASLTVREGAVAASVALLGFAGALAMIAAGVFRSSVRWRAWATVAPGGAAALAGLTMIGDGIAALWSTPEPAGAGTRFAVLDAVRVGAVLLCQVTLAYLATRGSASADGPAPASTPEYPSDQ